MPVLLSISLAAPAFADFPAFLQPDRRRDQFRDNPGHVIVPYAFSLPGIGSGYGVIGALTNIGGSYTDVLGTFVVGEIQGQILAVDAIHLIPKRLVADAGVSHLSSLQLRSYGQRGMSSPKEDYSLVQFDDLFYGGARLTATFMERRLESSLAYYQGSLKLKALRDRDGNLILDAKDSPRFTEGSWFLGGSADFTDDRTDPRRGFRFEPTLSWTPPRKLGPDYYRAGYSLTGFVPVGARSTFAVNLFRSDALVQSKGQTDPAGVQQDAGIDCSTLTNPTEKAECDAFVANQIASNKYGNATALGGFSRLRGYSEQRYTGGHAEFIGTEMRWNLTDVVKPFNIYVMKDIRTAMQIALFYELGTVADTRGELWEKSRSSYGMGFRLITASGIVYRFDMATGNEGTQPSVFFQYPWEL